MQTQEILARGICVQNKKILLAYFHDKDYYFLPGGHVEPGESVTVGLAREIKEELNILASIGDVLSIFEHSWKDGEKLVYELNFLISFSIPENTELISQVKHLDFKWVGLDELGSVRFLPQELTKEIEQLLNGNNIPRFKSSL